ncbi:hypothetical protein [Calidithermus roseus]|uniref:Uncharacterized protein n=1 Tax=Calidithermus roseus TaxID=1644118 RepID=A0A399EQ54_9DEIN|nr:hypothetical protein [Calidithermus roseus]RIH84271.1 hypothetical protein Mrose_02702 [Calidithermus roseus]
MKKIVWLSSILLLGLTTAQPNPPTPPAPVAPYPHHFAEKAFRELAEAQARRAYWQSIRPSQTPAWLAQADSLLSRAQADLQAQRFFSAKEGAEAAKKAYEAALALNGWWGPGPAGRGKGGWHGDHFYRAQERVWRLEAEMNYFRSNHPAVRAFLQGAKGLLSAQASPWQAEAAHKLADAGLHVLKAERGF